MERGIWIFTSEVECFWSGGGRKDPFPPHLGGDPKGMYSSIGENCT